MQVLPSTASEYQVDSQGRRKNYHARDHDYPSHGFQKFLWLQLVQNTIKLFHDKGTSDRLERPRNGMACSHPRETKVDLNANAPLTY